MREGQEEDSLIADSQTRFRQSVRTESMVSIDEEWAAQRSDISIKRYNCGGASATIKGTNQIQFAPFHDCCDPLPQLNPSHFTSSFAHARGGLRCCLRVIHTGNSWGISPSCRRGHKIIPPTHRTHRTHRSIRASRLPRKTQQNKWQK